jgi:hypothetical protein
MGMNSMPKGGETMKAIRIPKARATARLLADAKAFASSASYGARSGAVGSADRTRAEEVTARAWCAVHCKGAVEVTDLFPATSKVNEYHHAHARTLPAEGRVDARLAIVMFTKVTRETATFIEGETATSKGHGRVFIVPRDILA